MGFDGFKRVLSLKKFENRLSGAENAHFRSGSDHVMRF